MRNAANWLRRRVTAPSLSAAAIPALAASLLVAASPATAQQDTVQQQIRASQERLRELREERERLQREMQNLVGRARDISSELRNIERQVTLSADALAELDEQTAALALSVGEITSELVRARDRLRERNVVLSQRFRTIYRQGPMHSVRVLLSAQSFGDLMNRYKYLHLISVHDRLLLDEIGSLEQVLTKQEQELKVSLAQLERLRSEKLSEFAELQYLEQERALTLQNVRERVTRTEDRIQQVEEDEKRLAGVVEDLERRRLAAERRRAAAGIAAAPGALSARDFGQLPWPAEGRVVYRFGPERRPNGVTLRRNGIGIAAQPGTPVRAVKAGTVEVAGPIEGFGRGVIVGHGGGYYTVYLYLGEVSVQTGQDVTAGQVVGAVGAASNEDGAHLYFQLQTPVQGGTPIPVDPLPWLLSRR